MKKREELIRKFDAVDERGNVYTITKLAEYALVETSDESEWEEGLHRLELEDGSAVNAVGDFFQVVDSGLVLREVDLPE